MDAEAGALGCLVVDREDLFKLGVILDLAELDVAAHGLADVRPGGLGHFRHQFVVRPGKVQDQRPRDQHSVGGGPEAGGCNGTGEGGFLVPVRFDAQRHSAVADGSMVRQAGQDGRGVLHRTHRAAGDVRQGAEGERQPPDQQLGAAHGLVAVIDQYPFHGPAVHRFGLAPAPQLLRMSLKPVNVFVPEGAVSTGHNSRNHGFNPIPRPETADPRSALGAPGICVRQTGDQLLRAYPSHLLAWCSPSTKRMVPDLERITMDWVRTLSLEYRTPLSRSPSVMPVSAKYQLSMETR